jgi:hypothetical protein
LEEKVEVLDAQIQETQEQIDQISENNPELSVAPGVALNAETEPTALASAEIISSANRTASAVGPTGLVEENPVIAQSLRGEFAAKASGISPSPAAPETNIDFAALQQQLRPVGMGSA